MSDPVTNVAIEDVLSSIRRLVSEDARVRPLGLRAEPEVPEASAGKLVLTPALRVSAPAGDDAGDDAQGEAQQDAATEAELSAVDQDHSEDAPTQDAVQGDLSDQLAEDDAHHPAEAEMAQDGDDAAMAWEDHLDDARDTAPEDMVSEAAETHDAWTMSSPAPEGGEAMIADVEDPAASADFVFASSRDAAGYEDATGQSAAYDAADDGEPAASIFRDEDTILDEESLRELVAEIVRQELQGALGERITRNVRKLVRREIHRALTSHELE